MAKFADIPVDTARRMVKASRLVLRNEAALRQLGKPQPRSFEAAAGMWVELTSAYNATTGYAWKRVIPDTAGTDFTDPDTPATGDYLFDPNGNEGRASGERVFIRPHSATAGGERTWMIVSTGGTARVAIVVSATRDGDNWRWVYTMQWAANGGSGYGVWTGHGDTFTAYNLCEQLNGETGVLGNGINTANLQSGFTTQPAPENYPHLMHYLNGKWWFEYENGVDGECP